MKAKRTYGFLPALRVALVERSNPELLGYRGTITPLETRRGHLLLSRNNITQLSTLMRVVQC